MVKRREIRNSTAEFLIFQAEDKEQGVEVYYKNENIWATQKAISTWFDCDRSVVTRHLGNIFESGELTEDKVCAKFAHTASDGKTYNTKFYSLDAFIAVGYRVNSIRPPVFSPSSELPLYKERLLFLPILLNKSAKSAKKFNDSSKENKKTARKSKESD